MFYWLLLGLGVANLAFVVWTFRGDVTLLEVQDDGSEYFPHRGKAQRVWEETKATLQEKVVWLLSLFFFFYLGVGITAGSESVQPLHFNPRLIICN